jgi:FPC/CPF motif-containing protein YcgG
LSETISEKNLNRPALEENIREFILDRSFPCVGAKSAVQNGRLTVYVARSIESSWDDVAIQERLMRFAWDYTQEPALFTSFAVIFEGPDRLSEEEFENSLWDRVQSLTDKDAWLGQDHDARVSADPDDPHFALSFGGQAFFVVGLHPRASRPARRFSHPAMVFNLHDQFQMLRGQNRYEKLRDAILDRDVRLAGDINPMLARHGEISEARQYSGRIIEPEWICPYSRTPAAAAHPDPLAALNSFLERPDV